MRRILPVALFACLTARADDGIYRDAGASAFQFLKVEVSARAAALGGTVLLNSGPLSGMSCPSGLAGVDGLTLTACHAGYLGSATQNAAALTWGGGRFRFSAGISTISAGGLEYRGDVPPSEPLGTFDYLDLAVSGAAAVRLGAVDAGLGAKIIHEEIWDTDDWGMAVDASAAFHPTGWLDIALAVQNVGPSVDFGERPGYRMPMTWRTGARVTPVLPLAGPVSVSAEMCKPIDNEVSGGAGVELNPVGWLDLRTGYRFGSDSQDLTAGLGLSYGGWALDYAWIPGALSLGDVHRIVLTTRL